MKEQYIRKVGRALRLPESDKEDVIRDLREAFDSAEEHGETEQELLERLGTPREYANNIHEQLGMLERLRGRRKMLGRILILITVSAVTLLSGLSLIFLRDFQTPPGVIGQANGMTQIQVVGEFPDPAWLLLFIGFIALAAGIFLFIRYLRKGK